MIKRSGLFLVLLAFVITGCGPKYPLGVYQFNAFIACDTSSTKLVRLHADHEGYPFRSAAFHTPNGWTEMTCEKLDEMNWNCLADNLVAYSSSPGYPSWYQFRVVANDPTSPDGIFTRITACQEPLCVASKPEVSILLQCPENGIMQGDITTKFVNSGVPSLIESRGVGWECMLQDSQHIRCAVDADQVLYPTKYPVILFKIQFQASGEFSSPGYYYAMIPDCQDASFTAELSCQSDLGYELVVLSSPADFVNIGFVEAPGELPCTISPGIATCSVSSLIPALTGDFIMIRIGYSTPQGGFGHEMYVQIPNCGFHLGDAIPLFELEEIGCHSASKMFAMMTLPESVKSNEVLGAITVRDCNANYKCYPVEGQSQELYCVGEKAILDPDNCPIHVCANEIGREVCKDLTAPIALNCPVEMAPTSQKVDCSSYANSTSCQAAGCVWHFVSAGADFCSNK